MSATPRESSAVTPATLHQKKRDGQPIIALTAYDYPSARLADQAGIDLILVGDSLAMTVLGHPNTLSVTMDEMLHHTRAVRRAVQHALLVADMPFGSYHVSSDETVRNALRFVQDAGAAAVKLEGGRGRAPLVARLTAEEIPVVGHIGLTPQSVNVMGGYKVQGKTLPAAESLLQDALALQDAGAIAVVLEGMPREVARLITQSVEIPTIGIGAGPDCDGQILVFHDVFELSFTPKARFARAFGDVGSVIERGLEAFREAVQNRTFPSDAESYHLSADVAAELFPHSAELAGKR